MTDWRAWFLDDLSTDGSVSEARRLTDGDERFTIVANRVKHGQSGNYVQVMNRPDVADNDIAVVLDGDDWFPDPGVLRRVLDAYADGRAWMTWGSYLSEYADGRREIGCSQPIDIDNIRQEAWVVSHLRTWRVFLFRAIRDEDLRDPETGWYWLAGADVPFIFPMAEMAGCSHARYLRQINYIYNYCNPISEFRTHPQEQNRTERILRTMPKYARLERL